MREIMEQTHRMARLYAGSTTDTYSAPHILRLVLMQLAMEAGVTVHLHTSFMAAMRKGNVVTEVLAHTKSGIYEYKAKRVVDATGDANVIASIGEDYVLGSEPGVFRQLQEAGLDKLHFEETDYAPYAHSGALQPVSYMFTMGNVHGEAAENLINKRLTYQDLGITRRISPRFRMPARMDLKRMGTSCRCPKAVCSSFAGYGQANTPSICRG